MCDGKCLARIPGNTKYSAKPLGKSTLWKALSTSASAMKRAVPGSTSIRLKDAVVGNSV